MGAVVIGPVQQPDTVRADPEVLHQGGGTAKIGGAMPDPGLSLVLPARLAGQPDLAPFAQGELLRGEGVEQLGPTPGAGKKSVALGMVSSAIRMRPSGREEKR